MRITGIVKASNAPVIRIDNGIAVFTLEKVECGTANPAIQIVSSTSVTGTISMLEGPSNVYRFGMAIYSTSAIITGYAIGGTVGPSAGAIQFNGGSMIWVGTIKGNYGNSNINFSAGAYINGSGYFEATRFEGSDNGLAPGLEER